MRKPVFFMVMAVVMINIQATGGGGHQGVFTPGMSALARLAMGMLAAEGMIAVARWP